MTAPLDRAGSSHDHGNCQLCDWLEADHARALAEKDADLAVARRQRDEARANADFLRESIGECHLMISRDSPDFQMKQEWNSTDLPPRLGSIMRKGIALEAALAEKDAEVSEANAAWAKAVAEKARYAEATERDRETWQVTRGALLDEHRALRDRLAALEAALAEKDAEVAEARREVASLDEMWAKLDEIGRQPSGSSLRIAVLEADLAAMRGQVKGLADELTTGAHALYRQKAILASDRDWLLEKVARLEVALASSPGAALPESLEPILGFQLGHTVDVPRRVAAQTAEAMPEGWRATAREVVEALRQATERMTTLTIRGDLEAGDELTTTRLIARWRALLARPEVQEMRGR